MVLIPNPLLVKTATQFVVLASALLALLAASAAFGAGPEYVVVDLGAPPGYSESSAAQINNYGPVAGSTGGFGHAFIFSGGSWHDLGDHDDVFNVDPVFPIQWAALAARRNNALFHSDTARAADQPDREKVAALNIATGLGGRRLFRCWWSAPQLFFRAAPVLFSFPFGMAFFFPKSAGQGGNFVFGRIVFSIVHSGSDCKHFACARTLGCRNYARSFFRENPERIVPLGRHARGEVMSPYEENVRLPFVPNGLCFGRVAGVGS